MVRVVHHLAICIACGSLLLLWLRVQQLSPSAVRWVRQLVFFSLVVMLITPLLLLLSHGEVLLPEASAIARIAAALSTWIGQIIALQLALGCVALLSVWLMGASLLSLALVFFIAVLTALRSHVIASGDLGLASIAATLHIAIAVLWLTSLVALLISQYAHRRDTGFDWRALLQVISRRAPLAMLLLLITGLMLADRTIATGAALVATPYGWSLLIKLLMVTGALFCALQLRRWLAGSNKISAPLAAQWLRIESGFALMVLFFAGLMAITIPAAHDIIDWPLSFRIAPIAAYLQHGAEVLWFSLAGATLLFTTAWFTLRVWRQSMPRALLLGIAGLLVVASLVIPALSVDAYPTTYLHSPISFDAPSIGAGERHYQKWCVSCHGVYGRGDGPLASSLRKSPANLTEPHVQWHTHGDLYWWITNGMASSDMPGFSKQMTDDERWQLLNFLTAMSLGYEARPLSPRISPKDPWLPAIDFRYALASGDSMSLTEWREQGKHVLLHFVNDLSSMNTSSTLLIPSDSVAVKCIVVAMKPDTRAKTTPIERQNIQTSTSLIPSCDAVYDSEYQIASAWVHYRRTLSDPDFNNERIDIAGMWFLIDRFGFVRARWAADELSPSADQLRAMLTQLMDEPEIRPANIHARR